MERINFEVDKIEKISPEEQNIESSFAVLSVDFFSSGRNKHTLYISDDTLEKTASTIYNKPILFRYDKRTDDAGSHDPMEQPVGVIPEASKLTKKSLPDGRIMLCASPIFIWKRYESKLMEIFERDKSKSVSVELSVYATQEMENGDTELTDFVYEGITILGDDITPAIEGAHMDVLQFAKEERKLFEADFEKQFGHKYEELSFSIPQSVKENCEEGLALYSCYKRGGNSVSLAFAHHMLKNDVATPEKVRQAAKFHANKNPDDFQKTTPPSNGYIGHSLWGGKSGHSWSKNLSEKLDEIDNRKRAYFDKQGGDLITMPYKSMKDVNPAIKGIDPEPSLAQANAIAAQADAIIKENPKANGWPMAIASFKKTHVVKDGKWVEKASMSDEEFADKSDWGKGESIEVDKSKDAMSTSPWGNTDKTALMHKVLNAKNYSSLVHDVYAKVDEGWEDHPSSSLHYPIMSISGGKAVYNRYGLSSALQRAKAQGESGVVSKVNGLYEKLGLNEKEEMAIFGDAEEIEQKEDKKPMGDKEKLKFEEEEAAKAKMAEEEAAKARMAEDEKKGKEGSPQEEKTEPPSEAKKEGDVKEAKMDDDDDDEDAKKFAKMFECLPDVKASKLMALLDAEEGAKFEDEDDDDDDEEAKAGKYAKKFARKFDEEEGDARFSKAIGVVYKKMSKMARKMSKMADDNKAYMAENEALRKFKADVEASKFSYEVSKTMEEIKAAVELPEEKEKILMEDLKKFSLETLDGWKNEVKAAAFDCVKKTKKSDKKDEVKKFALAWDTIEKKTGDSLWG